jgi:hypothetical protein
MTENKAGAASRELGVMEGRGFYNKHSRPQRGAVAFGLPLLEHVVEAVPLPGPGEVFQVADYGVAGETTPWSRCERSSTGSGAGLPTTSPSPDERFRSAVLAAGLPGQLFAGDVQRLCIRGGQVFLRAALSRIPSPHWLERDRDSLAQPRPCLHPRLHLVQPGNRYGKGSLRPAVGRRLASLPRPPEARASTRRPPRRPGRRER